MGFPNPYQYNAAQYFYTTEMASGSVNGWLSGAAAIQHTAAWSGSAGEYYSIYVVASGANPPASVKFGDVLVKPVSLFSLIVPTAGNSSVNMIGPGVSGVNTANVVGYFNAVCPMAPAVFVDPGAGASWFKIVVVGR